MIEMKDQYLIRLREKIDSYSFISDESWGLIQSLVRFRELKKDEIFLHHGEVALDIQFLCKGAIIAYFSDQNGNTYNKNIFMENDFVGSTVSMMKKTPSNFTLEAVTDSVIIEMNYEKYRNFIMDQPDLTKFYIAFLERNWVVEKEEREISIVMENATDRYIQLLAKHPDIDKKVPQLHIASHLGITPTQLSRIRKSLKK